MHDERSMPARLATYLTARDADGRTATVTTYRPIIGGYSRLMARADIEWSDGVTESVVLRGDPPPGKSMMETDRDLEWALLTALAGAVRMPAPRHYDADGESLGTKCIVLEHVDGPSLQAVLTTLPADEDGTVDFGRHGADLVDTMAALHSVDTSVVEGVLDRPDDWDTYLDGLIDRFRQADAAHIEAVPFLRYCAAWLDAHRPPPLPLRLVHSDFQTSNIVVDPDGAHHLIDWELTHVGDPREDLGYYNVYSTALGPNLFAADPEGFLARYREQTGFGEDAVNLETMAYFTSLAAVTVYAQVLGGAAAMARGANGGLDDDLHDQRADGRPRQLHVRLHGARAGQRPDAQPADDRAAAARLPRRAAERDRAGGRRRAGQDRRADDGERAAQLRRPGGPRGGVDARGGGGDDRRSPPACRPARSRPPRSRPTVAAHAAGASDSRHLDDVCATYDLAGRAFGAALEAVMAGEGELADELHREGASRARRAPRQRAPDHGRVGLRRAERERRPAFSSGSWSHRRPGSGRERAGSTCSSSPAGTRSRPSRSSPCSTTCRASDGPAPPPPRPGTTSLSSTTCPGCGSPASDPPAELIEPSADQRAVIDQLCADGAGLVFLHHAVAGWPAWPEYAELVGGRFHYQPGRMGGVDYPDSGYVFDVTHTVEVLAPEHPVCAGLGESFTLTDELYCFPVLSDDVTPLMRTTFDTSDASQFFSADLAIRGQRESNDGWTHPPGSDLVAWTRQAGASRVVYLQFGDGPVTYADPAFRRALSNAIGWAARP